MARATQHYQICKPFMPQPLVGAMMHLQAAGSATQHARFAIVCKRHLALNAPCYRAHVVGVGVGVAAACGHCVLFVSVVVLIINIVKRVNPCFDIKRFGLSDKRLVGC